MSAAAVAAEVVEAFEEGVANRRIIAGEPLHASPWNTGKDGIRRRLVSFEKGARFILSLWERNDYGTTRWRVVVCEAISPGSAGVRVPSVRPAVDLLADIQGVYRARAFLAWLRQQGDRVDRFTPIELARIELHFQRMPLARIRAIAGHK